MQTLRIGVRGSSLVEVMIATLLLSVAVSLITISVLNAMLIQTRVGKKEVVVNSIDRLLVELRNYVTEDTSPRAGAPGSPPGSWKLPGDTCNCWALKTGITHNGKFFLPAKFVGNPHNATLTYQVTLGPNGTRRVNASFDMDP